MSIWGTVGRIAVPQRDNWSAETVAGPLAEVDVATSANMNDGIRLSAHRALEGLVVILSTDDAKKLAGLLTDAADSIEAARRRRQR